MRMIDCLNKAQEEKTGRTLGIRRLLEYIPEHRHDELLRLHRKERLPVRLAVAVMDEGWPRCICGNKLPAARHGFNFEKFCSRDCKSDQVRARVGDLKRRLRKERSTYRVTDIVDFSIILTCTSCGNVKKRRLRSVDAGTCPCQKGKKISKTLRLTRKEFEEKLEGRKITVVGRYRRMNARIDMRCDVCGTEWSPIASNVIIRKSGCPNYKCDNHTMIKNSLTKYGVRHSSQRPEVREKYRRTMRERFGVDHPSQNRQLLEKALYSAYGFVEYKLGDRIV